jgi:hypothetical protein
MGAFMGGEAVGINVYKKLMKVKLCCAARGKWRLDSDTANS